MKVSDRNFEKLSRIDQFHWHSVIPERDQLQSLRVGDPYGRTTEVKMFMSILRFQTSITDGYHRLVVGVFDTIALDT